MTATAAIFVFDGVEDLEAVAAIDFLRRAKINVTVVSLASSTRVTTSHSLVLVVDTTIHELAPDAKFDALCLPGGAGTYANIKLLQQKNPSMQRLETMFQAQAQARRLCAAICAAPIMLAMFGVLEGATVSCYPGTEDDVMKVTRPPKAVNPAADISTYGNYLITSRGPGTALQWSHRITQQLVGAQTADAVAKQMLMHIF